MAQESHSINMTWVWGITFFVVVVFGGLVTPWEAIFYLISNKGVDDEGAALLSFVAGYTLPLTIGFGVITFLLITGLCEHYHWTLQCIGAAAILWLCGEAAATLGLRAVLPDFTTWKTLATTGPPYIRPLLIVVHAYLVAYGWPLMVSALAIGGACAIQLQQWIYSNENGQDH